MNKYEDNDNSSYNDLLVMNKDSIKRFIMWSFNFDYLKLPDMYKFLAEGDEVKSEKIKDKFERTLECCGRSGVANQFFCDIDEEMQDKLLQWIDENYQLSVKNNN